MLQDRPKFSAWRQDRTGTWWRPGTPYDALVVLCDAADGNGYVLAGSPEEADRIDRETFADAVSVRSTIEDGAKMVFTGLIVALLSVAATGAAEWLGRLS